MTGSVAGSLLFLVIFVDEYSLTGSLGLLPGIDHFQGQFGFYEICRAADATQIYGLHISSMER
jgi:hypothetical protein